MKKKVSIGIFVLCLFLFGMLVQANDMVELQISNEDAVPGEKVEITAHVSDELTEYQYEFYVVRDGKKIVLQAYSNKDKCIWTPYTPAYYEVCVDVKDVNGEVCTSSKSFEVKRTRMKVELTNVNPISAAEKGATITMQAELSNGSGQYCFYVIRDGRKIVLQNYSDSNRCIWKPYTPAEYILGVEVKDVNGNVVSDSVAYTVQNSSLNMATFSVNPSPYISVGSEAVLTAEAEGGVGEKQYSFYVVRDGKKIILRNYSVENTYKWHPYTVADYQVYAEVKDENGNISTKQISCKVNPSDLEMDLFEVNPSDTVQAEETVQLAVKGVKGKGKYQYQYYVVRDGRKIILQTYSENDTYIWKPYTAGNYIIYASIKDEAGSVVTSSKDFYVEPLPFSIKKFSIAEDGIIYSGEKVTVTTEVTGGVKPYQCQYYVIRNGNPADKIMLKDFSAELTYIWTPRTPAQYEVICVFRDAWGNEETTSQDVEVLPATVELKDFTVGNNRIAQQKQEVPLSVELEEKGDVGTLQYKYYVVRDGKEIVLKDYSTDGTYTWKPITPALYDVHVDIIDGNGNSYHDMKQLEVVEQKLFVESFTVYPSESAEQGEKVVLSAKGAGGTGGYWYKFYVIRNGKKILLKDFSENGMYIWVPITSAKYEIKVCIQDGQGLEIVESKEFIVGKYNVISQKIDQLRQYTYVPYRYGGASINGWDCSGFTQWALASLGVAIPRTSISQSQNGVFVDPYDQTQWKPGDILCYQGVNGQISHVALYLGNGELMHALNTKRGTLIQGVDYYERWDSGTTLAVVKRYL